MPSYLRQKIVNLVVKATGLASYEAFTFDWIQKMMNSKQKGIVEGAFRIMVDRTDPSKYLKWNIHRKTWIESIHEHHIHQFI